MKQEKPDLVTETAHCGYGSFRFMTAYLIFIPSLLNQALIY